MIRILLWPLVLPLRLLYFAYCRLRNLRRPALFLSHTVPDRFTMHRPSGWAAMFVPQREAHYFDYLFLLRTIERSRGLQNVVLRIPELHCSWSEADEIARRLDAIRAGGKTLTAYLEGGNLKSLYVAAPADHRLSSENADFLCARPAAEPLFLGRALQRLGVRVEVLTAGRFKSAGELFTRNNLSAPAREALVSIIRDLRHDIDSRLASAPNLSAAHAASTLRLIRDHALLRSEDLVASGFLHGTVRSAELEGYVLARATDAPKAKRSRKKRDKKRPEHRGSDQESLPDAALVHRAYTDEVAVVRRYHRERFRPVRQGARPTVAIVALTGNMVGGRRGDPIRPELIATAPYQDLLEGLREGPEEAVFLFINSPGGTASGSEQLFQSIRALDETKPVFAVLGPVAASGGYYIALAARRIFASPNSISGSVGVFSMHADFQTLYRRIGVGRDRVAFDPTQDALSESRPLSARARALMKEHVASTYELFLNRMTAGRTKTAAEARRMAEGRVWSGRAFARAGFLDESLDLLGALDWYRQTAGYPEHTQIRLHFYPQIRTDLRSLLSRFPIDLSRVGPVPPAARSAIQMLEACRPVFEQAHGRPLLHFPAQYFLSGL